MTTGGTFTEECGCQVIVFRGGASIGYCPVHGAAPHMLDALKAAGEALDAKRAGWPSMVTLAWAWRKVQDALRMTGTEPDTSETGLDEIKYGPDVDSPVRVMSRPVRPVTDIRPVVRQEIPATTEEETRENRWMLHAGAAYQAALRGEPEAAIRSHLYYVTDDPHLQDIAGAASILKRVTESYYFGG